MIKRLMLLWSFAILWLYIGSIINFHQHRLFGHQLLPATLSSSRVKDKDCVKNLTKYSYTDFLDGFVADSPNAIDLPELTADRLSISGYKAPVASSLLYRLDLLRGPPDRS